MTTRFHIIAVIYYESYLEKFLKIISYIKLTSHPVSVYLVINNKDVKNEAVECLLGELIRGVRIIRHDNSGYEFGAMQAGLDAARQIIRAGDVCLFCNDTVGSHQLIDKFYIRSFSKEVNSRAGDGCIFGKIDYSERLLTLNGFVASRWVRSNFFAVDTLALEHLEYKLYIPELELLIQNSSESSRFFLNEIGRPLREHISNWLFGGTGHSWYGAAELSAENSARMAGKARCILQELYLSMRLEGKSAAFRQMPALNWPRRIARRLGYAVF